MENEISFSFTSPSVVYLSVVLLHIVRWWHKCALPGVNDWQKLEARQQVVVI